MGALGRREKVFLTTNSDSKTVNRAGAACTALAAEGVEVVVGGRYVEESAIGANDLGLCLEWTTLMHGGLQGSRTMDANGELWLLPVSGGQTLQPGVVRDVGGLAFNELVEERGLLVVMHGIRKIANLPLGDEHFQTSHDLVFELLV